MCETSTKSVKHCYYCTLRPVSRNVSPWTDSDGWALWVNISNSDKGYIELHRLELFLPFRYSMGVDPRRPGNSPLPAITWVGGNCGWATVIQYLGPVVYNCRHQGGELLTSPCFKSIHKFNYILICLMCCRISYFCGDEQKWVNGTNTDPLWATSSVLLWKSVESDNCLLSTTTQSTEQLYKWTHFGFVHSQEVSVHLNKKSHAV